MVHGTSKPRCKRWKKLCVGYIRGLHKSLLLSSFPQHHKEGDTC